MPTSSVQPNLKSSEGRSGGRSRAGELMEAEIRFPTLSRILVNSLHKLSGLLCSRAIPGNLKVTRADAWE